jgi:hypothetical protein
MGTVIQFPTFDEREWEKIAEAFSQLLLQAGADRAAADWICNDMKPRYLALAAGQNFAVPDLCLETANSMISFFRDAFNRALLQILMLEIQLYVVQKYLKDNPQLVKAF